MTFLLLAALFWSLGQAPKPADDFAFRVEYGLCATDVLDTFEAVFFRDAGAQTPPLSIPLRLSTESLGVVFQAITTAQFFEYASDFRTTPPNNCIVTPDRNGRGQVECPGARAFAPASHYKLTARNAGVTHTVSWIDGIVPSSEQADRLRNMFVTIIETIRGLPDVQRLIRDLQRLPHMQTACG